MLPKSVLEFLADAARRARTGPPDRDTSLFQSGLLDSFSLIDFVTLLESECGIKVDDRDLRPENFDTIARVEEFIRRTGASR